MSSLPSPSDRPEPIEAFGVLLIAKAPVPGRVKTRLQPTFTAAQAAALAEAALRDTLDVASKADWLGVALDLCGLPTAPDWIPGEVIVQVDGTLGERLDAAFAEARRRTSLPLVLLGMDTPQVTLDDLRQTLALLESADFCLGLAEDGGFWTLAVRGDVPPVLAHIPMSQSDTGQRTSQALSQHGQITHGPVLEDVDDPASAARVAAAKPNSRFATLHRDFASATGTSVSTRTLDR